ncbi:hypothetical protein GMST_40020 [Geomonas silvestris]|uniref:Uncharacterized protein n=1 Tax=Geomonas silvestris TaxID=2740184 RepID=A0A6V8MP65_9BACT|nr:hypothetical protein GMST_40020 [Geomonas silvestris]
MECDGLEGAITPEGKEMTYDTGWLKRRVSAAATEYDKWSPSLKEAMKLTPNNPSNEKPIASTPKAQTVDLK